MDVGLTLQQVADLLTYTSYWALKKIIL